MLIFSFEMFWLTLSESSGGWDGKTDMRAERKKKKEERGGVEGIKAGKKAKQRRRRRWGIVFSGITTVSAIKHEGDYCVGEFA